MDRDSFVDREVVRLLINNTAHIAYNYCIDVLNNIAY